VVKEEKINGKTKRSQICSSPVKLNLKKVIKKFKNLTWFGSARLGSAHLGSARLGSARLDLAWFGLVWLSLAWLNLT
jgi:hypothetical protein